MSLCSVCGGYYERAKCGCQSLFLTSSTDQQTKPISEIATFRFSFSAGRLIKGQVVSILKEYLFLHGLEYEVEEDKGWLESAFRIRIKGNSNAIADARNWIKAQSDLWQQKRRKE